MSEEITTTSTLMEAPPEEQTRPLAEPAKPDEAVAPKVAGSRRVIRDAEGVIVGARGAGPKILGVIDLKGVSRGRPKSNGGDSGKPGGQRAGGAPSLRRGAPEPGSRSRPRW